jgi:hypothetical protein
MSSQQLSAVADVQKGLLLVCVCNGNLGLALTLVISCPALPAADILKMSPRTLEVVAVAGEFSGPVCDAR